MSALPKTFPVVSAATDQRLANAFRACPWMRSHTPNAVTHTCRWASVLPRDVARIAVEAGVSGGWRNYVGAGGDPHAAVVGIDRFAESAPAGVLSKDFGFTADDVAAAIRGTLKA